MKIAYYPGCSLENSSEAYDLSVRAVCAVLDLDLVEIEDWNCCGATEAHALGQVPAHALVARNLARVDPSLDQIAAPCAACFLNLKKTDTVMREHPVLGNKISSALAAGGLSYAPGSVKVRHLLEVIHAEVGEDRLRNHVKQPLVGLCVAPYYGCQIVRPEGGIHDTEYPTQLDDILEWLGAAVVDFPLKSHCCGGHMTQISEGISNELIRRLLDNADGWEADLIACLCPMCQLNLDAYQGRVNNAFNTDYYLPALFFTQLIGLALGIEPKELGIGMELVSAANVLDEKLGLAPPPETKKARRRKTTSLPRPNRGEPS